MTALPDDLVIPAIVLSGAVFVTCFLFWRHTFGKADYTAKEEMKAVAQFMTYTLAVFLLGMILGIWVTP